MSKQAKREAVQRMARQLYVNMPGAPAVPRDDEGFKMWGDIDGTDHWRFCETIATLIVQNSAAVFVDAD